MKNLHRLASLFSLAWIAAVIANPVAHAEGDISGIWRAERWQSQVLPEEPMFSPAGQEAQRNFDTSADPYLRCIVYMPRAMIAWTSSSLEIIQSEERVWILFEAYHQVRRIFLDGRPPPGGVGATWLGHSTGHWEGDTLVVETTGLRGDTSYFWEGLPLSESTRLIERFTRLDEATLEIRMTVTDPVNYLEPWETRHVFSLHPDAHFYEYECDRIAQ